MARGRTGPTNIDDMNQYVGPDWDQGTLYEVERMPTRYPYSFSKRDRNHDYASQNPWDVRAYRGQELAEGFTPGDVQSTRTPRRIRIPID